MMYCKDPPTCDEMKVFIFHDNFIGCFNEVRLEGWWQQTEKAYIMHTAGSGLQATGSAYAHYSFHAKEIASHNKIDFSKVKLCNF